MQYLQADFQVGERRACAVVGVDRSSNYRSTAQDQTALRPRLRDLATVRVRYGYRRLYVLLRREGWPVNHTWVYCVYRLEGLVLRRGWPAQTGDRSPRRFQSGSAAQ